jgi:DNA primase large subunit
LSTIYGTVVDKQINVDIKKLNSIETYKGYRLAYRTENGEIREIAKAMASLKFTPSVAAALEALNVGDAFTLVQQKNDKGYLDVKSLSQGKMEVSAEAVSTEAGENVTPTTVNSPSMSKSVGTKVTSTYETPEERKLKQRLIVRQAALNQALEYTAGGDVDV